MLSKLRNQFETVMPYLSPDVLVPAILGLFGLYMFVVAVFSLERL
jgi:hypothetical protein